jgi:exopolysaccharide biosynthesis polyprenyl glycosylphosphotransferase
MKRATPPTVAERDNGRRLPRGGEQPKRNSGTKVSQCQTFPAAWAVAGRGQRRAAGRKHVGTRWISHRNAIRPLRGECLLQRASSSQRYPMPDTLSTIAVSDATISVADVSHSDVIRVRRPKPAARPHAALVRRVGVIACLDSLAAVAALVAVLVAVNLPSVSGGIDSFLSARVTVKNVLLLVFLGTAWPILFHLFGLYQVRRIQHLGSEMSRLVLATTAGCGLAVIVPLTSVSGSMTIGNLRHFWLTSLAFLLVVRTGRRAVENARHRQVRRTLIVGTGRLARRAYRDIQASRPRRYEVVGFIDEPTNGGTPFNRFEERTIGTLGELEQILMRQVIDEVVIALPVKSRYEQIQFAIGVCERAGVHAKYGADLFETMVAFPRYDAEGDRPFVAMHVVPDDDRLIVKRAIDIVGAAMGLVVLAPVMLIVAIAIKLTSAGPIIYAQNRCGHNKRPLRMYKFRSMFADADKAQAALEKRNEASGPVFKIRDDPRVTPVGRLLRKSSLDELPQLWNVLRGDMSLVGPRPLPWRDVHRIARPSDMRRFSMRPGLTCLWQVRGRSNLSFERWVELDLEYIDGWSLSLDFRILLKTIPAVLSGNGAT